MREEHISEEDIARFVAALDDARGFEVATTAIDGWEPPEVRPAWHPWVCRALGRVLLALARYADSPPFGVAVAEDATRGRLYEQGPCETVGWFLERVQLELLATTTEPWLFVVAPYGDRLPNERSTTLREALTRPGLPGELRLEWYFEARGRGEARRMNGYLGLTARWATLYDLTRPGATRRFDVVLRGHPARRRHPIRG